MNDVIFLVLLIKQNNSKPRVLLAGIRQHITHLCFRYTKLRPCHYLSHGSLT